MHAERLAENAPTVYVLSTDGVTAAVTGTPPTSQKTTAGSRSSGVNPPTVPTSVDRGLLSSSFQTLPFQTWSPRAPEARSPEPPRLLTHTSPPVPPLLTTAGLPHPTRSSPAAARSSPTGLPAWRLTSAPLTLAGGDVVHCQVQLANNYHEALNASGGGEGGSRYVYGRELGPGVARLCRVDDARISDVGVFENQHTGLSVCPCDNALLVCSRALQICAQILVTIT